MGNELSILSGNEKSHQEADGDLLLDRSWTAASISVLDANTSTLRAGVDISTLLAGVSLRLPGRTRRIINEAQLLAEIPTSVIVAYNRRTVTETKDDHMW